jgi:S-adenosylmethionine hydrolase
MEKYVIALLSDFGSKSHYTGVMKGVISGIYSDVNIFDITNEVQPQNIKEAAFILSASVKYFPEKTIFLAVVDPGVGSERRPIGVKSGERYFVAPDNGILSYLSDDFNFDIVVELNNEEYHLKDKSFTFHGRDIFAPIAGFLAKGVSIEKMGKIIKAKELNLIPKPSVKKDDFGFFHGEIIFIDNFGNLITSFKASKLDLDCEKAAKYHIQIGYSNIYGIMRTYSDVDPQGLLAYVGSSGYLEIGVRNGSASEKLHSSLGQEVLLSVIP